MVKPIHLGSIQSFREPLGTQQNWREVVSLVTLNGIPVPAFSASLGYYDSYRAERLPANLLQVMTESREDDTNFVLPAIAKAGLRPRANSCSRKGDTAQEAERLVEPMTDADRLSAIPGFSKAYRRRDGSAPSGRSLPSWSPGRHCHSACIIDAPPAVPHIPLVVIGEKKEHQVRETPKSVEKRVIRLKPFTSDYATFARTTSAALGITGPASQKTKPNMLALWLVNLASSSHQD